MIKPKPLQPKPKIINTHPLLEHRLAAADNGWPQIAAREKHGCKTWPRMANDREAILNHALWRDEYYTGTGVRVERNIAVYDLDVSIKEVADAILDDLFEIDPDAYEGAIRRNSGGNKLALFYRCRVPFTALLSHKYTAHPEHLPVLEAARALPETSPEESLARGAAIKAAFDLLEAQKVEFYGPQSRGRLFQFEGPHSEGRAYQCEGGRAPWNVRLEDVTLLPAAYDQPLKHGELIDRADKILAEHLTLIPEEKDTGGDVVYDLMPDMLFYPKEGGVGSIEDLSEGLGWGAEHGIYGCLPSTLASESKGNCKLYVTTSGRVMVLNWARNGRKHYMTSDAPSPPYEFSAETAALLRGMLPPPPPPPESELQPPPEPRRWARSLYELDVTDNPQDNYNRAINWMAQELAYCASANKGKGGVYSLWPGGQWHRYPVTLIALRTLMQPYAIVNEGPNGGLHVRSPVDAWLTGNVRNPDDTQRFEARLRAASIDGLRFRPDLEEPVYREDTKQYLNIYTPPHHPTSGGDTRVFHDFLVHLIPGEEDRCLVWQWLGYKIQHPWEPMFTLMMAAPTAFGTGRGTLGVILGRVLGEEYLQEVNFDELTGRSAAARWTAAAIADKLLVLVNEAVGDEDDYKVRVRTAGYERLKLMLDVDSESLRTREAKNEMPYQQRSSCSCIMMTNHKNPVKMPMGERRMAVVRNGDDRMTRDQRGTVRCWARERENIGALWRELKTMRIDAAFDPQEPPMNAAKEEMVELSKTEIDLAWEAARGAIKGKLFTCSQALALMREHSELEYGGMWERVARVRMTDWAHWLRQSANASRCFYENKQQVVYVLDKEDRLTFADARPEMITAELDKNQTRRKNAAGLKLVPKGHSKPVPGE